MKKLKLISIFKSKYKWQQKYIILYGIIISIIGAGLYSFFLDFFILTSGIYSGGFTGITQIIVYSIFDREQHFLISFWFYIIYLLLNTPLFIIGFFYIGKIFTLYTIIGIIFQNIFSLIWKIDYFDYLKSISLTFLSSNEYNKTIGILFMGIFSSILWAASNSIVYHAGGCGGGTDFIAIFLAFKYNKNIGKYQRIIQILILFLAIFIEYFNKNPYSYNSIFEAYLNNPIFFASLLFSIFASLTFDFCYKNRKIVSTTIEGKNISMELIIKISTKYKFKLINCEIIDNNKIKIITNYKDQKNIINELYNSNYKYSYYFINVKEIK